MLQELEEMVQSLDRVIEASSDPPDQPPLSVGGFIRTGRLGRPAYDIDADTLATLSVGRTRRTNIAGLYGCSSKTIRRRLVDYGISEPGDMPYTETIDEQGNVVRTYRRGFCSDLSKLTGEELDTLVSEVHRRFPSWGHRMIDGFLLEKGHRVPRSRIEESFIRVVGQARPFHRTKLQRRIYSVPGPNSLWHHDGQHGRIQYRRYIDLTVFTGLVRWKIFLHGFIDGFAWMVMGLQASNNNRASTVLAFFDCICAVFGYPSRLRGDHGTENLYVAARMEQVRGPDRGSYIWGRYAQIVFFM